MKRYELIDNATGENPHDTHLVETTDGSFILFSDHLAEIARKDETIEYLTKRLRVVGTQEEKSDVG